MDWIGLDWMENVLSCNIMVTMDNNKSYVCRRVNIIIDLRQGFNRFVTKEKKVGAILFF